jgi:AraC-like DNA-binding protein
MKDTKSLQKLTESDSKIQAVYDLKEITMDDYNSLSKKEQGKLMEILNTNFNAARGVERERIWNKIEKVTSEETRNRNWEQNHDNIICVIHNHIQDYGRMPTVSTIADKTELSRQTVHKHLKEYKKNPIYLKQQEQFQFMASMLLAKVYHFALNGDMSAAKLYLNATGCLNGGASTSLIQNNQNNIQINNTVISQETISKLNASQLREIEEILECAEPERSSEIR